MDKSVLNQFRIAVIGLGYVGLPLVTAFGRKPFGRVIGFDIRSERVEAIRNGQDPNNDVPTTEIAAATVDYTTDPSILRDANFLVVTVPTPITKANAPDFQPLIAASEIIGAHMSRGSTVVFESTVYPGATEEVCVPIIERVSGMRCGVDWFVGYSPERVNPGDREHTLEKIVKVVSGMDADTLRRVTEVYSAICPAGVHRAPNIKTAEASKVIENVQRDLNIALMNELALIFARIGIRTKDVLAAAGTKWNFHHYSPGLVGGHCIGVDPYYLTYKAEELGYHPQVILAGRRINDGMPTYVTETIIRALIQAGVMVQGARALFLGLTFKENVRDTRNAKIHEVVKQLQEYGVSCVGHDPHLTREEIEKFVSESVASIEDARGFDVVILGVLHREYAERSLDAYAHVFREGLMGVFVDLKSHYLESYMQMPVLQKKIVYRSL